MNLKTDNQDNVTGIPKVSQEGIVVAVFLAFLSHSWVILRQFGRRVPVCFCRWSWH